MLLHEIAMRWADLDQLNHVNNVVYADYATQAREVHESRGELPGRPVKATGIDFLRPLLFTREPVVVATALDGDELVQEIRTGTDDGAYARVTSTYGEVAAHRVEPPAGDTHSVRVRLSDLGADGVVTPVKLIEYAQEARVASISRIVGTDPGGFVLARIDVEPGEPICWQEEPLPIDTSIVGLGRSSVTTVSRFAGGRHGVARAVLVGFDLPTQRSRPWTAQERELFRPAVRSAPAD